MRTIYELTNLAGHLMKFSLRLDQRRLNWSGRPVLPNGKPELEQVVDANSFALSLACSLCGKWTFGILG